MDKNDIRWIEIDSMADWLINCGFDDDWAEEIRPYIEEHTGETYTETGEDLMEKFEEILANNVSYLSNSGRYYYFNEMICRFKGKKEIKIDFNCFYDDILDICEEFAEIIEDDLKYWADELRANPSEDVLNEAILNAESLIQYREALADKIRQNPLPIFEYILFGNNRKLSDIPSICFETAEDCTSARLGLCDVCGICYARNDFRLYDGHRNRMNANVQIMRVILENPEIYGLFKKALKYFDVSVLRYNLAGDFRKASDIEFIKRLAEDCPGILIYGYSKRQDLAIEIEEILLNHNNIFCGVPESMANDCPSANVFKPVKSLAEWFEAHKFGRDCLGDCMKCRKCFTWRGRRIACLCHGSASKIQKLLNTAENTAFIIDFFKIVLSVDISDRMAGTGLFCVKINQALEAEGFAMPYHLTRKGNKSYDLNTVPKLIKWAEFVGGSHNEF